MKRNEITTVSLTEKHHEVRFSSRDIFPSFLSRCLNLANKFKLTTLAMAYRCSASPVELYCGKNTKMQFGVHPKIPGPPFDLNIGPLWVANQTAR